MAGSVERDYDAEGISEKVREWRRHLHRHPELSFEEVETSRFVYETLESFGGLELSRLTKTSVVARLVGEGGEGRTVALRADMDALPIQEETGLPFASENPGVMHACGHDGHTAILLGVAKTLLEAKEELKGEVRFVFQHAEEKGPGGAGDLVEAGVMEGVDVVVGLHLWAYLEVGRVGIGYGPVAAATDTFEVVVKGEEGHAAWPHRAVDPVAAAAEVVMSLQHVVSREVDPLESAVVSVTRISGGKATNIIPGSVELEGTVRTLDEQVRRRMPEVMERVVAGVTAAHGATYSFSYLPGNKPVVNDEEVTRVVEETVREILGDEACERMRPLMGGEDFSAYQQVVPGTFFFVGARNEEKGITASHHHPRFDIDEEALDTGVELMVRAASRLLDTNI